MIMNIQDIETARKILREYYKGYRKARKLVMTMQYGLYRAKCKCCQKYRLIEIGDTKCNSCWRVINKFSGIS